MVTFKMLCKRALEKKYRVIEKLGVSGVEVGYILKKKGDIEKEFRLKGDAYLFLEGEVD